MLPYFLLLFIQANLKKPTLKIYLCVVGGKQLYVIPTRKSGGTTHVPVTM